MSAGRPSVSWYDSASDVPAAAWGALDAAGAIDRSQRYRAFREIVEPGRSFAAVVTSGPDPVAGATGAWATPATPLMSDPWALLTSRQFLRLDASATDGGSDDLAEAVERRWRALLSSLAAGCPAGGRSAVDQASLHAALGPCLVVRGFDSSEVLLADGLSQPARRSALETAVMRLMAEATRDRVAGVAFPYVDAADLELRDVLHRAGFVSGSFTATSVFDLTGVGSYAELEQNLPARVRRRFRNEQRCFAEAGLLLTDIDLVEEIDTIVRLESGNVRKHGRATADHGLHRIRTSMARLLAGNVRVQAARDTASGEFAACGIDLYDDRNYLGLVYGQDYSRPAGPLYPVVSYYGPMQFAISRGIARMRMGFEAYLPKIIRGAYLEPRHTFIWHPDPAKRQLIGQLLALLHERFIEAVAGWARQRDSSDHWQLAARQLTD